MVVDVLQAPLDCTYFDGVGVHLDLAPRHCLVWPRSRIAAVELVSGVHKHAEVGAIALQEHTYNR